MRTLTPGERREIEAIRHTISNIDMTIEIRESNAEIWRNVLDLALQMNDVLQDKWRQSPAPIAEIAAEL